MSNVFINTPVVVLCGGKGIVLSEKQNCRINKGLIIVADKPIFLWVIFHYVLHGATDFILATGIQGEQFGPALVNFGAIAVQGQTGFYTVTTDFATFTVRIVQTLPDATTAGRLLACKPWLDHVERFAVTYSDTLSTVDLSSEMRFHKAENRVATLVATQSPVRFRILGVRHGETLVRAFAPRPVIESSSINGGYYLFTRDLWNEDYGLNSSVALENQPLDRLAAFAQLAAFAHKGEWQYCDAERDLPTLEGMALRLEELLKIRSSKFDHTRSLTLT